MKRNPLKPMTFSATVDFQERFDPNDLIDKVRKHFADDECSQCDDIHGAAWCVLADNMDLGFSGEIRDIDWPKEFDAMLDDLAAETPDGDEPSFMDALCELAVDADSPTLHHNVATLIKEHRLDRTGDLRHLTQKYVNDIRFGRLGAAS